MNSLRPVTVRDWQDEVEPRKRPRSQIGSGGVFVFQRSGRRHDELTEAGAVKRPQTEVVPRLIRPLGSGWILGDFLFRAIC